MTLEERITDYLANGGLFNPELMDHAEVRNLVIECRDQLTAAQRENAELRKALDAMKGQK